MLGQATGSASTRYLTLDNQIWATIDAAGTHTQIAHHQNTILGTANSTGTPTLTTYDPWESRPQTPLMPVSQATSMTPHSTPGCSKPVAPISPRPRRLHQPRPEQHPRSERHKRARRLRIGQPNKRFRPQRAAVPETDQPDHRQDQLTVRGRHPRGRRTATRPNQRAGPRQRVNQQR